MTYLVERRVQLRRHLDHLRDLRPRVSGPEALERDLSLHMSERLGLHQPDEDQ